MFVARLCALRQRGARNPSARLLFTCADPWKRSTESGVAVEAPSVPEREGAPPPASSGGGEGRPFSSVSSLDRDSTYDVGSSSNIKWHESPVTRDAREKQLNQRGCVLWMTGLSGSGKSTVAFTLEHMLQERGKVCYVLDGDNLRHGLNHDLGFTPACREENIRRIGEVAKIMSQAGIITVVAIISPFAKDRDRVRETMKASDFHEVYVKVPLSVCESRDPKGLYRKAREGKIKGFTGIDAPYEEPCRPEVTLRTDQSTPAKMAKELWDYLRAKGKTSYKD